MKQRLKELTILLVALGVIGLTVLFWGVVPIAASSGHWPVTRLLLDFASDRSVDFHSSGIEPPPLDEPGMVRLGAATYESNCRWCHGRPGLPAPVIASHMTPTPPYLPEATLDHESRELFYIIKHGIKFAGMPAWPTQQREDGIWPVVAFLKSLPDMSEETYMRHTNPKAESDSKVAQLAAENCAACHGEGGHGRAGQQVPVIAGQTQAYLALSLRAYKSGQRYSGIMQPIAARLDDQEIAFLSEHYSAAKRAPTDRSASDDNQKEPANERLELGRTLAIQGDGEQKIPACVDCHGPGPILRSSEYPKLAGQSAWFIRKQLQLFASKSRGGKNANLMHPVANKLNAEQIDALAAYYSQAETVVDKSHE